MKNLKETGTRIQMIDKKMEEDSEEYDKLEEELGQQNDGKIIVENIAYPGVKMTISSVTSHIHKETQHSAFVRDGADIRIRAI